MSIKERLLSCRLWQRRFPKSLENAFVKEWTCHLKINAKTYNGLFTGLVRIFEGTAKKPEKIINEWCSRTRFNFENTKVNILCQKHLLPLCKNNCQEQYQRWASLLLEAAKKAGITCESHSRIILNEGNITAYIEWDDNELFLGDDVEIINPAWYQNGKVIEQGHCTK